VKERIWGRLPARGQDALKTSLFRINYLTAARRRLPDYLIIGTQRGGTTSLYRYLTAHPQVAPAFTKEIHYFDLNYRRGSRWYRAHFPLEGTVRRTARVCGEASPSYLFHPLAAARAAQLVPAARLIVLLRNPVDRAFSHYLHQVREGLESLSFEDALGHEPERLAGEQERLIRDQSYTGFSFVHYSYRARGTYADQLETWLSYFPRDQFIILSSEEFFRSPGATVRRVLSHLGVPDADLGPYRVYNPTDAGEMRPETRRVLEHFYRSHNDRLYRLIDQDFGW
jgi:hypothetical protein